MPDGATNDPRTALRWRKSSRSADGNNGGSDCVQVAWLDDHGARAVRDSKLADASPVFILSPANWRALRSAALDGTLDAATR